MYHSLELKALSSPEALEEFVNSQFKPFPYKTPSGEIKWDYKDIGNYWVMHYNSLVHLYQHLETLGNILVYRDCASYGILWHAYRVQTHIIKYMRRLHKLGLITHETYVVYQYLGSPIKRFYEIFGRHATLRSDGYWRI